MSRIPRPRLSLLRVGLALGAGLACGGGESFQGRSSVLEDPAETVDDGLGPTPREVNESDRYADRLTPRGEYRPRFYGPVTPRTEQPI